MTTTSVDGARRSDAHIVVPALELGGITKSFGAVIALRNVDLSVRRGEVHALLGENGAGKSTLMAITAGVVQPDVGTVAIGGTSTKGMSAADVRDLGLAVVYQHPALLDDLTVAENLALGVPAAKRPESLRRSNAWARDVLIAHGLPIAPSTRLDMLSLAQRQQVEIARALISDPKVLVLDEPTESLSAEQSDQLFSSVRDLTDRGVAVIYISHRLPDVRRVSDRITVLRDGMSQGTFETKDVDDQLLLRLIVGRSVSGAFPPKSTGAGPVRLTVGSLSSASFSNVELTAAGGEIVGLAGIDGNGQREFLRAIAGVEPAEGSTHVDGKRVANGSPSAAIRSGVVYIAGDRQREGLMLDLPVRTNVTLLSLRRYARAGWINRSRETAEVEAQRDHLSIRMSSPEAPAKSLSGGNQQKLLFARAILARPAVLLADEPTHGVDAGARLDIYAELRRVADDGAAVVLLSTDAVELRGLCDRVVVFSRGQIVRELAGDAVTEEAITHASVTSTTIRKGVDRRADQSSALRKYLQNDYAPAALLTAVALCVGAYTALQNDRYLTAANFTSFLYLAAILMLAGAAQAIVVFTGGIDLSIGPLIAMVTVVSSYTMTSDSLLSMTAGVLAAVGVAMLVGATNGLLVVRVRITPVIATLVTFFSIQGLNLLIRETAGGRTSGRFSDLLDGAVGPIPIVFALAVMCCVGLEFALRTSMWGLRLRAVGSNPDVAGRAGVDVDRTITFAYITCSFVTCLAALLFVGLIQVGDPRGGINYTLSSIAVVVLGGIAISGGRGSFLGVMAGALVLQQTTNVSTFLRLDSAWQYWFVGGLTLLAAAIYSVARTGRGSA